MDDMDLLGYTDATLNLIEEQLDCNLFYDMDDAIYNDDQRLSVIEVRVPIRYNVMASFFYKRETGVDNWQLTFFYGEKWQETYVQQLIWDIMYQTPLYVDCVYVGKDDVDVEKMMDEKLTKVIPSYKKRIIKKD